MSFHETLLYYVGKEKTLKRIFSIIALSFHYCLNIRENVEHLQLYLLVQPMEK
jgi:hypothetical protein